VRCDVPDPLTLSLLRLATTACPPGSPPPYPQELLHLLESGPARLQSAFVSRACADPCSPTFATQPRHSLLRLADLGAVLAEAMPGWAPATVAYAAQQLVWHVNVVSYNCAGSPSASGGGGQQGGSGGAQPGAAALPSNMMYAEMAASIIAAAETEGAATDARLLPSAQQFVAAVATALAAAEDVEARLQELWEGAAASSRCVRGGAGPQARRAWPGRGTWRRWSRLQGEARRCGSQPAGRPAGHVPVAQPAREGPITPRPPSAVPAPLPRPATIADVAGWLVDHLQAQSPAGQHPRDSRARAWLAAALLPILKLGAAPAPGAVRSAVAQLKKACGQLPPLVAEHLPLTSASTPLAGDGARGGIANNVALRRWQVGGSWSRASSGETGSNFNGVAPWRGAVSVDEAHAASAEPADVLTLID
jgi:hypothetical protein